ncbi:MAG: class I SAM-dependent methyltransferase [Cyclobacteriaceae bacterium]|nr:class I SAM-dependent methyltransferase [Cyclobacteriaceae bacterium]
MVHQLISYVNHWLNEVNSHSLQAPFIYNFFTKYIQRDFNKGLFESIEQTRRKLLDEDYLVATVNYGAISIVHPDSQQTKVSTIAKNGLTPAKVSRLLARLIEFNDAKNIIELGTSFGLNTLYLAQKENSSVVTFEGSEDIANVALTNFEHHQKNNIELVLGNIDKTLPTFLDARIRIDFAYIDANHKYKPTIEYFESIIKRMHKGSILVLDDIYWSKEMTQAWNEIKAHPEVTHSIDLFSVGIVFFQPDLVKTNYRLMF